MKKLKKIFPFALCLFLGAISSQLLIPAIHAKDEIAEGLATTYKPKVLSLDNTCWNGRIHEQVLLSLVGRFVINARTQTPDSNIVKDHMTDCYMHVTEDSEAIKKLDKWFSTHDGNRSYIGTSPFVTTVEITKVEKIDGLRFLVEWTEKSFSVNTGEKIGNSSKMRGEFYWTFGPQSNELLEIIYNPYSLIITDFNWEKL